MKYFLLLISIFTIHRLKAQQDSNEIVITGTLKAQSRLNSPVVVDVFQRSFFLKNPSPVLFENLGMINGVRPQYNCNVCSAGDIHINGMEGPYTMVLIDGMPIISSLGTVYGLTGIPVSMLERVEVVKGPAGALYGSEAIGGIINIITRRPNSGKHWNFESGISSWNETYLDLAWSGKSGRHGWFISPGALLYPGLHDINQDGFTDMAVQKRLTLPVKWEYAHRRGHEFGLFGRALFEDRWGGQLTWNPAFRGSDSIYGESILTNRAELIGKASMKWKLPVQFSGSVVHHAQRSWFGTNILNARQQVWFIQATTVRNIKNHELLGGLAMRYSVYDDNTPATGDQLENRPDKTALPGIFVQDELRMSRAVTLLAGYRMDHHNAHGLVHSPRLALKWKSRNNWVLRLNAGSGYRVVNIFTEEHAALTGSRRVVTAERLLPERSLSANMNLERTWKQTWGNLRSEFGVWNTRFSNKIIPDYNSDPDLIIYANLDGYAISRGASATADFTFGIPLGLKAGITYMEVYRNQSGLKDPQLLAPAWSGNFSLQYSFRRPAVVADISGQWYGPMKLPVLPHDPRPEYSPWYCQLQASLTHRISGAFSWFITGKNLLNFLPQQPILRPWDPFDKQVNDPVNNPHGHTFDASYNYAPMQGRRVMLGLRISL